MTAESTERLVQAGDRAARTYDSRTIFFHWLTAALVAEQWLGAHAIDWFPRGPLRTDARSVHILIGVGLAVVIAARLVWRQGRGRRLPPAHDGLLDLVARLMHAALYGLVVFIVGIGLAIIWIRGDSLFGVVQLAKPAFATKALRIQMQHLHVLAANTILVVAGLHAAAALWHQYWRRDGVLARMAPALRRDRG